MNRTGMLEPGNFCRDHELDLEGMRLKSSERGSSGVGQECAPVYQRQVE